MIILPSLKDVSEELSFLGTNIDNEHYVKLVVVKNNSWFIWSSDYLIYNNLAPVFPLQQNFAEDKILGSWFKIGNCISNSHIDYNDMAQQMIKSLRI